MSKKLLQNNFWSSFFFAFKTNMELFSTEQLIFASFRFYNGVVLFVIGIFIGTGATIVLFV